MIEHHGSRFADALAAAEQWIDPALALAVADGLATLSEELNGLACDLGQDDEIVRRHMIALQAIDRVVQAQQATVSVLRAGTAAALDHVPVEEFADRLRAAYAGHRRVQTG